MGVVTRKAKTCNAYESWECALPKVGEDKPAHGAHLRRICYPARALLLADLAVWNLSQREVEDVREGLRRVVFDAFHRSMSRRLTPQKWRLPTQSAALFNGLSMANETNPFDVQVSKRWGWCAC